MRRFAKKTPPPPDTATPPPELAALARAQGLTPDDYDTPLDLLHALAPTPESEPPRHALATATRILTTAAKALAGGKK
ncbi:MAG: hypothetical protein H0S85_15365 [Desulfovibrionaceae bacterium]|jgi:hypothetical protein|nr:hypothetical protein [Desulfovibrionaceae bacterium]